MIWHNGSFGYDNLNRLTAATDTSWSRTFGYDAYGNMSVTGNSNVPLNGLTPTNQGGNAYNPANNRLLEASYDAAGNMSAVGALSFWYDAEGRQTQSYDSGSQTRVYYSYDADRQRVQKTVSNGPTTIYIHDAFGQLAAEYASSAPAPPCTTCYLSYDHLGSVRLITNQNAQVVSRHDYLPFGEEIPNGSGGRSGNGFGAASNVNQMFTGQERDGEMTPNADFFNARYFMGVLGNFTSPDPANAGADLLNPQSWNGYGYVLGNPLNGVDPSGMWWCDPEDPSCEPDWPPPFFPPCIFFDCGGDGGGGGGRGRGGSSGGSNSNTPRSTPLPPNSFPGGETLGLPPGMHVPLPSPAVLLGLNLNLNCEFGVCIATLGIQPAGTNQQVTITNETIHDAIYQIKIPLNLLGPRGNGSEGNPGGRMAVTFQRAAPKTKGYGTYRAYASCYIGNVFANVIGDAPDMYGPGTVAVGIILKLGAKWGPAAVIPPAIAMSARAITTFDSVARGCAALNGYTPWILK